MKEIARTLAEFVHAAAESLRRAASLLRPAVAKTHQGPKAVLGGTAMAFLGATLPALFATMSAQGQSCSPGQQLTVWPTLQGYGQRISQGYTCGPLGAPSLTVSGLSFVPTLFTTTTTADGVQTCQGSVTRCVVEADFGGGCVGGASASMYGVVNIPPEGGIFRASIGVTATQQDTRCNGTWSTQAGYGTIEIRQPGQHVWAIYRSAFFSPEAGDSGSMLVSRAYSVCLTTNGGSGTAAVLGALDDAASACIADTDDGSGTGTPDGGVTIDDLLYYLVIFEQGTLASDVDDGSMTGTPDGGVTIDDLLYYLVRFEAGC